MKKTTIYLNRDYEEMLDRLAKWEGYNRSEMIRALIIREHVEFQCDMEKYKSKEEYFEETRKELEKRYPDNPNYKKENYYGIKSSRSKNNKRN